MYIYIAVNKMQIKLKYNLIVNNISYGDTL
jgi:hypothetical protein